MYIQANNGWIAQQTLIMKAWELWGAAGETCSFGWLCKSSMQGIGEARKMRASITKQHNGSIPRVQQCREAHLNKWHFGL
jgi:hypothetical protein